MDLFDSNGQRILTGKVLGRKGQGTVYEVCDGRELVAKVYHAPSSQQAAKLKCMLQIQSPRLLRIAAWPVDTVHSGVGSDVVGFLMRRVMEPNEVHEFYGIKSRMVKHPQVNWRFLLAVAANIARAFEEVHQHNLVIGDVNEGNLFISAQATVTLLDCDSFQIVTPIDRHLCGVGVENYTPPELQGVALRDVERTVEHDRFGLAVLIFLLLFLGRHPFVGKFQGSGEMPIGKAIKEYRFAYGDQASTRQMMPPPASLPLSDVSPLIASLFERAFLPPLPGKTRPTGLEWIKALDTLLARLKTCPQNGGHVYWEGCKNCPWCKIEAATGIVVFQIPVTNSGVFTSDFDIKIVWQQISAISIPAPLPPFPSPPQASPLPSAWAVSQKNAYSNGLSSFIAKLGLNSERNRAKREARDRLTSANNDLKALRNTWQTFNIRSISEHKSKLEEIKAVYMGLPAVRTKKLKQLEDNRRISQLNAYLDRFLIRQASIQGIGPGRTATLQAYGIESAKDIEMGKVMSVPGFGPSYTSRLLIWRKSIERNFVFNPALKVDPAEIQRIESEITAERNRLEIQLRQGVEHLKSLCLATEGHRQMLIQRANKCLQDIAQITTDIAYL